MLLFVPFLPRSVGLAPVPAPPNGAFVIAPSIARHSHSSPFHYHNPADQLATFFQIIHLPATLGIDHGRYLALHNIVAMLSIGSLYEGDKNTFIIFQSSFLGLSVFFSRSSSFLFRLGSDSNDFILFQNSTDIL
jgi:hypothetical protein